MQRAVGRCETVRGALNSSMSSEGEKNHLRRVRTDNLQRVFPLQNLSAGEFLNESGTAVDMISFRLLI